MAFVELQNLVKNYKQGETTVHALDGVTLEIEKGEFLVVLGASGSGKSTLLNALGGLDYVDSGKIMVDGKEISKLTNEEIAVYRRRVVGFVFQSFQLLPTLTVEENIEMPVLIDGKSLERDYLKELLENLELDGLEKRLPSQLSGGQQQRVAIARALANKPSLILADEPTGNLDSETSEKVVELLTTTCMKYGQTLVMITHNEEIAKAADRVVRIKNGKIME